MSLNIDQLIDDFSFEGDQKRKIMAIIKFGRHVNHLLVENKSGMSGGELIKEELIKYGVVPALAIQIKNAIDNPDAEIIFK